MPTRPSVDIEALVSHVCMKDLEGFLMSIIDNIRKTSINEFSSVIRTDEARADHFGTIIDKLNINADDATKLQSALKINSDRYHTRIDGEWQYKTARDEMRNNLGIVHNCEVVLVDLHRQFSSFDELRRAFAPIYAYFRTGYIFDATNNLVDGHTSTLEIPYGVTAEDIAERCKDALVTMPASTGRLPYIESVNTLVKLMDGSMDEFTDDEPQTMLISASGVSMYPSDFSVANRDGWIIADSPIMLCRAASHIPVHEQRVALPVDHPKSSNPAHLLSALMNEFMFVLPLSMVAAFIISLIEDETWMLIETDTTFTLEDGTNIISSDLSTYDQRITSN